VGRQQEPHGAPARVTLVFGVLSVGTGPSTDLWVFSLGLAVPAFSTPSMTVLQGTVEPEMQGRVFGFVGIVMALAMPVGMAMFGALPDRFRVETLLIAAGVALFAVVGLAPALPSGRRAMAAAGAHARHGPAASPPREQLPPALLGPGAGASGTDPGRVPVADPQIASRFAAAEPCGRNCARARPDAH
jgi:hypothetical protein